MMINLAKGFPTIESQFPGFDIATLPSNIPPYLLAKPWSNDLCPFWYGAGLMLAIDFDKTEDREFPEAPRFAVFVCEDDDCAGNDLYIGDDWAEALAVITANAKEA